MDVDGPFAGEEAVTTIETGWTKQIQKAGPRDKSKD
jgi:hypothetical protein